MTPESRHLRTSHRELRSRQAFLANPKIVIAIPAFEDGEDVLAAYLGAYCAGMRMRASPTEVFSALCDEPDLESQASATIRWLLGSIRVREAVRLVASCGVPIARLAEHVRAHQLRRPDMIAWLNQFAVPE